jgi:excisionase family DNA binding protein
VRISNVNGSERIERMLYSASEVSEMLGISAKSVYRLLDRGLLKSSSALRHKRISKASIDEFIARTTGGGG